jgi:MFS transporter, DHA1 family, chloramphenicol resistance protein
MRMVRFYTDRHKTTRRLPAAVYALGFAIFAQGTSELMLAGLLPGIARSLQVSIPHAGLLISAFAIGMLIGAPVLAVAARHWPRRRALLGFLAVFALAHVAGALAPGYTVLLATRIAGAFVYAGFWAVGAATAVDLVPAQARGRAMGILAGGLTLATVVGLPGGTLIGQHLGWRTAFWAVAALTALAAAGVLATIPADHPAAAGPAPQAPPALRAELRALASRQLWSAYATTAVATAALIVTFSYLSPLLTRTTGLPARWIPAVLGLYGAGALAGILVGGRTADRHPIATLRAGTVGLAAVSAALALAARHLAAAVILVAALGLAGFVTNPTLNSRPFNLVRAAPTLVAALNVSAFNAGITLGPWLGGLALSHRLGYTVPAWIGAALAAAVAAAAITSGRLPNHNATEPTNGSRGPLADKTALASAGPSRSASSRTRSDGPNRAA